MKTGMSTGLQPISRKARAGIGSIVVFIAACAIASAWHITSTIGSGDNPGRIGDTPAPAGAPSTPGPSGA